MEKLSATHAQRLRSLRQMVAAQDVANSADKASDTDRTAEHWGLDARARMNELNAYRYWTSHPVTAREINRLVSGDPDQGWMAYLKRRYFAVPGGRGLSMGCGSGAVVTDAARLGIVELMEGIDISPDAVTVANERARQMGVSDSVRFRVANFDLTRLDGSYDLVLFEQSLHHVGELDEVLDQCRDVLAPNGLFVINEYVGPDRFQWSDEAERLMNGLLQMLPASHRTDPATGYLKSRMVRPTPQQVIAVDPSEAIHSAAILDACSARFELVERRDFGGTLLQFMLADIVACFDPDDERDVALLKMMTMLEMEMIKAGAIESSFVFAVYRHRRTSASQVEAR